MHIQFLVPLDPGAIASFMCESPVQEYKLSIQLVEKPMFVEMNGGQALQIDCIVQVNRTGGLGR